MKIFFDLDGTLIDSRERLYCLFQHLVPASVLTFDEYWNYKRKKTGHEEILKSIFSFSQSEVDLFQKKWMEQIELPQWLALDKPFNGVTDYLIAAKKNYDLYLVTSRQFEDLALLQLTDYGWDDIFTNVFVTAQKSEKNDMIKKTIVTGAADWFVGDTGKDIQTGKSLGIKTAAVLSGFLNKEKLMEYKPDIIIDTILDFDPDNKKEYE
ncbi:MAG TPA: HAD hydrolase-like protein [Ferruginibacter sp.]|nr:HAD hydrolase-like protein [Ferruginibacter sp.]